MAKKPIVMYDPKRKAETQELSVYYAKDLVQVLQSVVDANPGAVAVGCTIRFDQGVTVFNSRGRPVANITTKL